MTLATMLSLALAPAAATGGKKAAGPPMPYLDFGACPFECCMYRDWTANTDTPVLRSRREGSRTVFVVRRGETVRATGGVVITTKPGLATVLEPTRVGKLQAKAGDSVLLLTNIGEGFCKTWFRGRVSEVEIYDERLFRIEREAESVWWVKIRNRKGQIGWSHFPEHYDNKDACG